MAIRAYYSSSTANFQDDDPQRILGVLTSEHMHALEETQRQAWLEEIALLKRAVKNVVGHLLLELHIPRIGKRADAALLLKDKLLVLEFKVGDERHSPSAVEQVIDYCLDLKNFHEGSHAAPIIPILVSTRANSQLIGSIRLSEDLVATPMLTNGEDLPALICALSHEALPGRIDLERWLGTGYKPTPTIIQAAQALYQGHSVDDISRSDAGARNLSVTSRCVQQIAERAQILQRKTLCFVTGVPVPARRSRASN